MYHAQSWWNYRHLSNILFVHFNDLLRESQSQQYEQIAAQRLAPELKRWLAAGSQVSAP